MMETNPTETPTPDSVAETPREVEGAVAVEFRQLGQRLAAALKAAASTDEAESLRGDIHDGIKQLRNELDQVLEATRTTTQKATGDSANRLSGLRGDLATAIRALSRVMERVAETVAETIEPDKKADDENPAAA